MSFQLEHLEMEFEAETWWFCSTHEGYKPTKFQLQTPSLSAPTGTRNPSCEVAGGYFAPILLQGRVVPDIRHTLYFLSRRGPKNQIGKSHGKMR